MNGKKNIPTVFVVFGATGDLMTKKITPALYNLFLKGKLPKMFRVIGYARKDLSREEFQKHITEILHTNDTFKIQKRLTEEFLNYFYYHKGNFRDIKDYKKLAGDLGRIDDEWKVCSNKLFYLAVPPQYYETIFRHLAGSGLTVPCGPDEGWTRVLVEKPFGKNAKTAEKLDLLLDKLFKEEQIYRIDHYLAKEMLQNILSFRFSNNILEENWNSKYIERIDIRLWETIGVEKRGIFYDGLGALRDVGQNHLLQMLALVAMEHPRDFNAESVRLKRALMLKTLIPPTKDEIEFHTLRAQYKGYKEIKNVKKNSKTETYFKMRGFLDSPRWRDVPITMESGKRMKEQIKDISVTFRHASPCLCPPEGSHLQDKIIFSLEPEEGIEIQFLSKKPGLEMQIEQRKLEFIYRKKSERVQYVEEYEKLLLDCIEGNQLLFLSTDEVKAMWRYIDPIVHTWGRNETPLLEYKPDSDDIFRKIQESAYRSGDRGHYVKQMSKEVGVVGLGKMGANTARNLLDKGWKVIGWNRTDSVTKELESERLIGAYSLEDLVGELAVPRVIWMMLPAGQATDDVLDQLEPLLDKGDIVIDAANAFYQDTIRRHRKLEKKGVNFFDVGFSGGPGGARHGACLMVGGDKKLFEYIHPLLIDLAASSGVEFFEGVGAGHFVKMVHNGIEYGMMQSLAEGFDILKQSKFKPDLTQVAKIYNHGSVIESRLTNWLERAFETHGSELKDLSGSAGSGGGGAGARVKDEADWIVDVAKQNNIPVKAIEDAIGARTASQKKPNFQGKIINALRNQFGGHKVR